MSPLSGSGRWEPYAGCFAAMGPERVFVVADTARTERYRAEAATFNGEPIRVTYLTYDEAAERAAEEPFDVVLYAVKYGALPEAIEQSAPLIGPRYRHHLGAQRRHERGSARRSASGGIASFCASPSRWTPARWAPR